MKRILELLNQKNHYLEKFYSLNEGQILNLSENDYSDLENFYESREAILAAIKYIDNEMEEEQRSEILEPNETERREVATCLAIKEEYVGRILAQDLEILANIESAKSSIIRELQDVKRNKKAVSSYKSRQYTNRLDEEV